MRAHALVEAAVDPRTGATRYPRLRSDPPLTLRSTPTGVHLVGSAAGPLSGDDLRLDVVVRAGAILTVRSVAAMLAQPGPAGGPSRLTIDVTVAAGGLLRWLPQPMILVRGCDHATHVYVRLAEGAGLVWRDEVVLGRHGEPTGSVLQRLRIDHADRPLLRNDLVAGPRWPGSLGPAGVGAGAGAVGAFVLVGVPGATTTSNRRHDEAAAADAPGPAVIERLQTGGPDARGAGVRMASLALDGGGVLVTAVAATAMALGAAFDALQSDASVPPALEPCEPGRTAPEPTAA